MGQRAWVLGSQLGPTPQKKSIGFLSMTLRKVQGDQYGRCAGVAPFWIGRKILPSSLGFVCRVGEGYNSWCTKSCRFPLQLKIQFFWFFLSPSPTTNDDALDRPSYLIAPFVRPKRNYRLSILQPGISPRTTEFFFLLSDIGRLIFNVSRRPNLTCIGPHTPTNNGVPSTYIIMHRPSK